jgi:chaperonin GroES
MKVSVFVTTGKSLKRISTRSQCLSSKQDRVLIEIGALDGRVLKNLSIPLEGSCFKTKSLARARKGRVRERQHSDFNGGSFMKFRPLHDRVVVKRIDAEEKSAGGIIIPDTVKEKPSQGEVIAVGPGARNEQGEIVALDVKVGDTVLFGKWSGTEVKLNGEDLLIMKESDIMGVVEAVAAVKKAA